MKTSKKNALYELSDDLYAIKNNAQNAHFILSELCDRFFDESFDGSAEAVQRIALRYDWARGCINILLDYDLAIRKALSDMVAAAGKSKDAE